MQIHESSIYISLKRLRRFLYHANCLMDKWQRPVLGKALLEASSQTIKYFTLAFMVKEKKMEYLEECMGWFAVLRNDIDFCMSERLIHYKKKVTNGESIPDDERFNSTQIETLKIIAKIDEDIIRWRTSLIKGKTFADINNDRREQH